MYNQPQPILLVGKSACLMSIPQVVPFHLSTVLPLTRRSPRQLQFPKKFTLSVEVEVEVEVESVDPLGGLLSALRGH